MYLAIFFAPLLIFINAFFFGKVYKRFIPNLNIFHVILFGLISYFGLYCLLLIPLILFTVNLKFILIYSLIYQLILMLMYALNWRWLFITYKVDIKKIIFFIFSLTLIFVGCILSCNFLNMPHFHWNIDNSILNILNQVNEKPFDQIVIFTQNKSFFSIPCINVLLQIFVYIFNINSVTEINIFVTSFIVILIHVFLALFISIVCYRHTNNKWYLILLLSLCVLSLSIIVFSFIKYAYTIIFCILLFLIHFKFKQSLVKQKYYLLILNLIVLCGVFFVPNFVFTSLIVNFIIIILTYINKYKTASDYSVNLLFSTILCFLLSFNSKYYLGVIFLIIFLLFYSFFILIRTSSTYKKTLLIIDNFLYKYSRFLLFMVILIIWLLTLLFFFFNGGFQFDLSWLINKNNISSNIELLSPGSSKARALYIFINSIFILANIFILIYAFIKNNLIFFKFEQDMSKNFLLSFFLLLWNPFSISIFSKINNLEIFDIKFDNFSFFWILFALIFLTSINKINNSNKIKLNICCSTSIITLSSISLLVFTNVF